MGKECLRGRRENTSNPCYSHSDEELTDTASTADSSGLESRVTPNEISARRVFRMSDRTNSICQRPTPLIFLTEAIFGLCMKSGSLDLGIEDRGFRENGRTSWNR